MKNQSGETGWKLRRPSHSCRLHISEGGLERAPTDGICSVEEAIDVLLLSFDDGRLHALGRFIHITDGVGWHLHNSFDTNAISPLPARDIVLFGRKCRDGHAKLDPSVLGHAHDAPRGHQHSVMSVPNGKAKLQRGLPAHPDGEVVVERRPCGCKYATQELVFSSSVRTYPVDADSDQASCPGYMAALARPAIPGRICDRAARDLRPCRTA